MDPNRKKNDNDTDADPHQRALDKMEEMWDRELAKGDDDLFELSRRMVDNKDIQQPDKRRRKGIRI